MRAPENPWNGYPRANPPEWAMQRRVAPFQTVCPACGQKARPYFCNDGSADVRCHWCNARFSPAGHVPPTVAGKAGRDASS